MELLIPLNAQDPRPLYEQIYQFIKEEIRRGNLPAGRKLPSTRELAGSLKVSRSTTQLAYEQLVSEGYLEAQPRRGYFAAGLEGILPPVETEKRRKTPPRQEKKERYGKYDPAGEPPVRVDFSPRGIDLDSFPFATWRRISRSVLRDEEKDIFLKGDPQGDAPLREAIRAYLHAARGVNCSASQILVGAGNEYLLMLLSGLLGRGAGIAMENPTYRQAWQVFSDLGHPVFPVRMDAGGMRPEELESLPDTVRAAYVMPSHQFPTGAVMPVKRRQELLSWAERGPERFLIEDDYDSEFRYKGKPVPALQGLDRDGRVIYMGTFSKAIAPAIRVGYLVLPEILLERYERQARFYSSTVSRVNQRILERFIAGGYFERHLNRMREIYKGKHDMLLAALKPLEPGFRIRGEFAGLHVLLTAKGNRTEKELAEAAAAAGVRVYGLSRFMIGEAQGSRRPGAPAGAAEKKPVGTVILGYAKLTEEEIRTGAELLLGAWS